MKYFPAGNDAILHGTFKVLNATLTNPTTMTFQYKPPSTGVWVDLVYGVDVEVQRTATGTYDATIDVGDDDGLWHYRFVGDAPAKGASPVMQFTVYAEDI